MSAFFSDKPSTLNRRVFLKGAAISCAVLVVRVIPVARAGEQDDFAAQDMLRIQSGESMLAPWTHHFHFLDVPLSALANPPGEGIRLSTTWKLLHSHEVVITAQELREIAAGKTVSVGDNAGDHIYVISLKS